MNCLTLRATLLADPHTQTAEVSDHLAECPACRAFAVSMMHEDALLRSAIDVTVPRELAARILLQTQIRHRRTDPLDQLRRWLGQWVTMPRMGLAAALSAVLAVALSVSQVDRPSNLNWGQVALAHAIAEPEATASKAVVARTSLETALQAYGLSLAGDLGVIRLVEHCAVPGGRGTHIVVETKDYGSVTLLLPPPGERPSPGSARGEGLSARMIDIVGVGVGVVATEQANLPALAALLARQIVARA
ncbi:DUF3379 family protein [Massilia psychrophila]|nr:DUF3379 family protein [Massilia psychrophila]GGE88110.1 hypothetical protein GCM10008020_36370 [Massilia psychrophila]